MSYSREIITSDFIRINMYIIITESRICAALAEVVLWLGRVKIITGNGSTSCSFNRDPFY